MQIRAPLRPQNPGLQSQPSIGLQAVVGSKRPWVRGLRAFERRLIGLSRDLAAIAPPHGFGVRPLLDYLDFQMFTATGIETAAALSKIE